MCAWGIGMGCEDSLMDNDNENTEMLLDNHYDSPLRFKFSYKFLKKFFSQCMFECDFVFIIYKFTSRVPFRWQRIEFLSLHVHRRQRTVFM